MSRTPFVPLWVSALLAIVFLGLIYNAAINTAIEDYRDYTLMELSR